MIDGHQLRCDIEIFKSPFELSTTAHNTSFFNVSYFKLYSYKITLIYYFILRYSFKREMCQCSHIPLMNILRESFQSLLFIFGILYIILISLLRAKYLYFEKISSFKMKICLIN